jgi:hypothetical protein
MVEEKKDAKEEDLRYKYIGFDVYPLKAKRFWKNTEEEKKYLEEVRSRKEHGERDHSVVYVSVFTPVERTILTLTSVLMILSLFLPWFKFSRGETVMSYNALQYLFKFGSLMIYSGLGGALMGILAVLFLLIIIVSFLLGIFNLLSLYGKDSLEERYLFKVKKTLRFNSIPFILWIVAIVLSIIGISTPLASALGTRQLKEVFNMVTLVSISGIGLWISLGCWVLNSVKANDL